LEQPPPFQITGKVLKRSYLPDLVEVGVVGRGLGAGRWADQETATPTFPSEGCQFFVETANRNQAIPVRLHHGTRPAKQGGAVVLSINHSQQPGDVHGGSVATAPKLFSNVECETLLNDLDWNQDGEVKLPNLVAGQPIRIFVRLDLPPLAQGRELCRFHLKWNDFRGTQGQELKADLTLPGVSGAVWDTLAPAVEVQEQVALLLIARLKRAATDCLDWGYVDEARRKLEEAKQILATAPRTPEVEQEAKALAEIQEHIDSGAWRKFTKRAKHQSYTRQSGRTSP
jgi:hypothetical protein